MNVFYEGLPESVFIGGKEYPVITHFAEWLRFLDMLKSELPTSIKLKLLLEMFPEEKPPLREEREFNEIIAAVQGFLNMEEISLPVSGGGRSEQMGKENISFSYDAPFIISAFRHDYGIDLLSVDYLHWWKFKMLLMGLDEKNQIKEMIYYRGVDLRGIKDKEERKRIKRIKAQISIPGDEYVSDGEIGNAFL